MNTLYSLLVVAHLLGMAALVGGAMVAVPRPVVNPPMLYGALTQLVTGLALVGLIESGAVDAEVDNAKIGVKLLVATVVAVLAFRHRKASSVSKGQLHTIGGLALVNVFVAVLW